MKEHSTYKECVNELKRFKRMHKNDTNVRNVECEQVLVLDDEIVVTKRIPGL